jgi:hypothetical protein
VSGVAELSGWFQQNKRTVGIAAGVGVTGLALLQARKRKAGGGPNTAAAANANVTPRPAGATIGGFAPLDSSGSDVARAIQPQIDYLRDLAERQAGQTVPVPSYDEGGFYEAASGSAIYQYRGGKLDRIESATAAKRMGANSKNIKFVSKDDAIWGLGRWDAATTK